MQTCHVDLSVYESLNRCSWTQGLCVSARLWPREAIKRIWIQDDLTIYDRRDKTAEKDGAVHTSTPRWGQSSRTLWVPVLICTGTARGRVAGTNEAMRSWDACRPQPSRRGRADRRACRAPSRVRRAHTPNQLLCQRYAGLKTSFLLLRRLRFQLKNGDLESGLSLSQGSH